MEGAVSESGDVRFGRGKGEQDRKKTDNSRKKAWGPCKGRGGGQ